ncbi:MAG: hypothetical protein HZA04_01665 [Nitrospinae bacterium]|nr:hypothetical protein [Nitrospinota bacterium]
MGVPNALLPRLFTREHRTSRPGTAGEKGNGLGLTFTHEIVKSHGGSLWAESDKGGSTFYVALP